MKATFWRSVWWYLSHPGAPADAAPHQPERRVVTADEAAGLGLAGQPTCDASASAGVLGRQMTFGPCVLREGHQGPVHKAADGSSWEPLDDTVPVPRDALRGLVEVARQVAASEPWPDPVPARNALAALYKARLIDRLGEDGDV